MVKENASKHVLVTGGAGFIGSHACLRLLEDGFTVTALDNLSRGNLGALKVLESLANPGQFRFCHADLSDLHNLYSIFAENSFDVVMHFAAVAYVAESMRYPLLYYKTNTRNVLNILDAMQAHNVTKFIHSSTCATYGEHEQMPITEETPQNPINPYGRSKKMAEEIIRDNGASNPEFCATILRYFNVIGSDPEGRLGEYPTSEFRQYSRITGACIDAAFGRVPSIKIMGTDFPTRDGTCVRDYIHVTDLVNAHMAAMKHLCRGQIRIFNVGTGKGVSVREFVTAWLKVTGLAIKVEEVEEKRAGDYAEVYCDPSKIQHELGWKACFTDLEEALATAWRWHKAHPYGYPSCFEDRNGESDDAVGILQELPSSDDCH